VLISKHSDSLYLFLSVTRARLHFYARKQLLLSARLSYRNFVRPFVRLSVCHTGGSVKNGAR